MSVDVRELRARLQKRVREVHAARRASSVNGEDCDHDFKRFKQTIIPDARPEWQTKLPGSREFTGSAHFILNGCIKCKRKHMLELVIRSS